MPLTSRAAHMLQWLVQRAAIPRGGANPKSQSQFGLESAPRLHEVGVASNPGSATPGGIRSRALYTPPVTPRKSVTPAAGGPTLGREPSKVGLVLGVKSYQGSRTGRCGWITSFLRSDVSYPY